MHQTNLRITTLVQGLPQLSITHFSSF